MMNLLLKVILDMAYLLMITTLYYQFLLHYLKMSSCILDCKVLAPNTPPAEPGCPADENLHLLLPYMVKR